MYLTDDCMEIPPDGELRLPGKELLAWVPAKNLRPFDFGDDQCRNVLGYQAARKFSDRLKATRKRQGHKGVMVATEGVLIAIKANLIC
ncbi:hypothetical protein NKR19_g9404 [Coniochaeta hoffmannii]|uniref:Uncharacterized protein n=1 Tax=Coniochaeta hoffmannii TaxID=91930 RepID=A0AA38RHG2_9PEZI|nr:hypothetical protein NKR19_g9404 [Coniochaeta hoffmannii]